MEQAQQLAASKGPPLRIKQLYVLAALEVEAFRKQALEAGGGDAAGAAATLLSAAGGGAATVAGTARGKGTSATMAAATLAGEGGAGKEGGGEGGWTAGDAAGVGSDVTVSTPFVDWMPCQLLTGTCGSVCLSGML